MALVVGGVAVDLTANSAQIINEMNKAARAVQQAAGQMQGSTNRWAAGFNNAERRINASLAGIGRGLRSIQGLALTIGAGLGAREIIRYADAWQLAEAQLRLVSGTAEEAIAIQERLFGVAQDLGVSVDALNTIYIRTARNAESLGVSQQDILRATEALGAAIRISGTSATEASNALIQLSQSFASGVLRGDELRSVAEQMPVVLDAIAAATGRTRQEIITFARENGIAADIVIQSLVRQRDAFVQHAAAVGGTVEQAMTRVFNAVQRVSGTGGRAGVFQPLVDGLNELAATLESTRISEAIAVMGARFVAFVNTTIQEFYKIGAVAEAVFAGEFSRALDIITGKLDIIGVKARQVSTQIAGLGLVPTAGELVRPSAPLPPLELRGAPAVGGGGSGADRLGEVFGPPVPPARFDPNKFRISTPPQFGPEFPGAGVLAEFQRGQEMIAANDRLIAQYAQINQGVQTFGQAFGQFAASAILKANSLTEAFQGFVQSLAQAAIQAVATQVAISAIGFAGGGGLLGALFPAPRALGGPVGAGHPYIVGERGPELFVPSRAGQIVPNNALAGGGSVINIDARQSTPGTAAAAVSQAVRLAPNAVANAGARGMMGRGRAPF